MTTTLDLDVSYAALCAAGAVCRRERRLRTSLASLLANPRDASAWAEVRSCTRPEEEQLLRSELDLLETVSQSGSAGSGMGGSPRTPFTEGESC
ncbi:hypothetical protein [Brachybacterium sp. AOP3-A1-3]|uniref:hypothetical protein n=1 Tax=Brachybacterium sp. AOP3-A1-3 TaxID=3457699 RepID=UPI004034668B